jgi:hypothetical protein
MTRQFSGEGVMPKTAKAAQPSASSQIESQALGIGMSSRHLSGFMQLATKHATLAASPSAIIVWHVS